MPSSRSKINASLRSLLAKRPRSLTAIGILDRFETAKPDKHDDRGVVLVSVALLELLLENVILVYCRKSYETPPDRDKLFGGNPETGGAINTFAGKIILGHALGIYGQDFRDDLDRLRRIRNTFAHSKSELNFKMRPIKEAMSFNMIDKLLMEAQVQRAKLHSIKKADRPRYDFIGAVSVAMIFLHSIAGMNRHLRPRTYRTKNFFYS